MKLTLRYHDLDWWAWLVIGVSIGVGLAGVWQAYLVTLAVSVIHLVYYVVRDRSLVSFPVQVREVWLACVLLALWPPLWWLFILMFLGMVMVVLFDRCGIARMLMLMPWNKDVKGGAC